jgi:predicted RNase H-like HicB family nuclease
VPGYNDLGVALEMKGLLRLEFRLPADIKKRGNIFVSFCPLLDVYSQGNTRAEALENLKEALRLFFESCFDRGTLEQVLRESGFESSEDVEAWSEGTHHEYIDVPLSLIAFKQHAEAHTN